MMPLLSHPWALLLLPLALLPFLAPTRAPLAWSDLAILPADPASDRLARSLQLAASVALAAIVAGLAGPYLPEAPFARVGLGAEIVLLLDRSRSMDQKFGPETNTLHAGDERTDESKAKIAKRLIGEFSAGRPNDVFSMIDFTNIAIPTLDFTQKQAAVQAAIRAADVGRGLSDTDIGHALQAAGERFSERVYTGSRIVLLVSDGGGQIEPDLRKYLTQLYRRNRIALYWIYIRSYYSPPLTGPIDTENEDAVPERFLNKFFGGIGIPYHAYEAQNPEALKRAIADVGRLEAHPITITDIAPRRDLSTPLFALAMLLSAALAWAKFLERREWI
jgi:mxaC protein